MIVNGIRFRMEEALCVLQVLEYGPQDNYGYGRSERKASWRDATATDLLEVAKYIRDYSDEEMKQRLDSLERDVCTLQMNRQEPR